MRLIISMSFYRLKEHNEQVKHEEWRVVNVSFSTQADEWLKIFSPELYELVKHFEDVEAWCLDADDPTLQKGLDRLEQTLAQPNLAANIDLTRLIFVLAHLHTSVAFYFMGQCSKIFPQFNGDILLYAEALIERKTPLEPEAKIIVERLRRLAVAKLFMQFFGKETRREVLECLQAMEGEAVL